MKNCICIAHPIFNFMEACICAEGQLERVSNDLDSRETTWLCPITGIKWQTTDPWPWRPG